MSAVGDAFRAGDLAQALAAATAAVKASPLDADARWLLAEMLLFAGETERADRVLDAVVRHEPSPPVLEFRRLLRAEVVRQQCVRAGRAPQFQGDAATPAQQATLRAAVLLRAGDAAGATAAAEEAETLRPLAPGAADGMGFGDLRDVDDLFAPQIEVLTAAGDYLLVPVERLRSLHFDAPRRPRDLFWRRCSIELKDGTEGTVFIPVLYPGLDPADSDALRLGHVTEWSEPKAGPVCGRGQRLLLAGENALPITAITEISFA